MCARARANVCVDQNIHSTYRANTGPVTGKTPIYIQWQNRTIVSGEAPASVWVKTGRAGGKTLIYIMEENGTGERQRHFSVYGAKRDKQGAIKQQQQTQKHEHDGLKYS